MRQRQSRSAHRRAHPAVLITIVLALVAGRGVPAAAQDNYEIQVYGSDLVPRGRTMVELHSNFTFQGSDGSDGLRPTEHALHETLEVTHGFSDFMEVGFYLFTSTTPSHGAEWVGTHVRPRFSIPESWHWPVGFSLSQEIGYVRPAFAADTWTWEIRPIVDQRLGRFYWSVNPALERTLKGPGTTAGVEFSPNVELAYDVTRKVQGALEYYGAFGSLQHFDPMVQTEQEIFPAVNLDLGPDWEFNLGVGRGLTPSTDRMLVKMIVGYRMGRGEGEGEGEGR